MLTQAQLCTQFALQSKANAAVNPAWREAGYPYLRGAFLEASEAMEHHGWKWWKKQECDLAQLQLELVDIWHFALSDMLLTSVGTDRGSQDDDAVLAHESLVAWERGSSDSLVFDEKTYRFSDFKGVVDAIELMGAMAGVRRFSTPLFGWILKQCDMSWNDLHRQYVCKNVLNVFRQAHGYKEGSYIKIWDGREDNEHLLEIANGLDAASPQFSVQILDGLTGRYTQILEDQLEEPTDTTSVAKVSMKG